MNFEEQIIQTINQILIVLNSRRAIIRDEDLDALKDILDDAFKDIWDDAQAWFTSGDDA